MQEEKTTLDAHGTINDALVHLFYAVLKMEETAMVSEEFKDITNNDMHILEAVGTDGRSTMSAIAKKLNITAGSLTTSVNGLVKKDYVERKRGETDRRRVYISLTEKGKRAYRHHENFHRQMADAVIQMLSEEELTILLKTLKRLSVFFYGIGEKN